MIPKRQTVKVRHILQGLGATLEIVPSYRTRGKVREQTRPRNGVRNLACSPGALIQDWEAVCGDGAKVAADLLAALKKLEKTIAAELKHGR